MRSLLLFLAPGLLAAAASFALTPLVRLLAFQVGAVDRPGARKVHKAPIARLGGLAVVAALIGLIGLRQGGVLPSTSPTPPGLVLGIVCGLLPIFAISVVDDIKALPALPKFLAHLLGASIAVHFGIVLEPHIHLFGREIVIGVFAVPLSLLWLVGVTNAFNIVDGLDGLSAGLALISAISLAAVFFISGQSGMASMALVLAGALLGFLPYNVFPASIFLGDTGATAIGFVLGCFALRGGATLSAGFAILVPLFALGLPVTETLISIARRVVRRFEKAGGSGVFEADRDHIHHRLLALGIDHQKAVLVLYGVGVLLGAGTLASLLMSAQKAGLLLVALLLAAFIGLARLGYDEFAVIRRGVVLRFYEAPVLKRGLFPVFFDLMLLTLALYGAVGLKYDDWGLDIQRPAFFDALAVTAPASLVSFWAFRLYRGSWRLANVDDVTRLTRAVATASAVTALLVVLLFSGSLSLIVIYSLLLLVGMGATRLSFRFFHHLNRRASVDGTPALIYGAGTGGTTALRELLFNSAVGLRPIGFLDDDPTKAGTLVNGYTVYGPLETLASFCAKREVGALIVSSGKIGADRVALASSVAGALGLHVYQFEIAFDVVDVEPRKGDAKVIPLRLEVRSGPGTA